MMLTRAMAAIVAFAVIVISGAPPLCAQSADGGPKFEVASIKPSPPDVHRSEFSGLSNGTFTATNVTLGEILAAAYGLVERRIIGPDWLAQEHFDFHAKSPEGIPDSEVKPLLQALLKERFQLAAHTELREMPVFNLVVAKGGVKMSVYPAPPRMPGNRRGSGMTGTGTASQLAEALSRQAGRPVFDKTGLSEKYNYVLIYTPPLRQAPGKAPEFAPPDLFVAVQEQLGLKLEPDKAKIEVVVIDHIERMPSEN